MIIFDLDGTLACCAHRRHFVDPDKNPDVTHGVPPGQRGPVMILRDYHKSSGEIWKPNWPAFYDACDQDKPIEPVCDLYSHYFCAGEDVQIWSGRCESVRDKTIDWLFNNSLTWIHPEEEGDHVEDIILKMRPIGDNTPDDVLKERWLDEAIAAGKTIDFAVDSDPSSISMWRRRGIFVFDVNQTGKEF